MCWLGGGGRGWIQYISLGETSYCCSYRAGNSSSSATAISLITHLCCRMAGAEREGFIVRSELRPSRFQISMHVPPTAYTFERLFEGAANDADLKRDPILESTRRKMWQCPPHQAAAGRATKENEVAGCGVRKEGDESLKSPLPSYPTSLFPLSSCF